MFAWFRRWRDERAAAKNAIATLVRMQIAEGLAPRFLTHKHPYKDDPQLTALMQDGLLSRAAFLQKPPALMKFYRRLLLAMEQEVTSILEIGVKGGGSTALWKAIFPSATVVGLDIKLRRWLKPQPSADGVIYIEGDQTDEELLRDAARRYGPFDLVLDDGAHIPDHQATSMRCLLPHVRPGGFYVVEDIQTPVKGPSAGRTVEYGADIWADFIAALFAEFRRAPIASTTAGARLAIEIVRRVDDLIVAKNVLAVRARGRSTAPD